MEQKNLQRAQNIVAGIAWCREALSFKEPAPEHYRLKLRKPNPNGSHYDITSEFSVSVAIREQAFRMFRREVEAKMAAYRREAAQIGLKLKD